MKQKITKFINKKSKEIKELAEIYPEKKSLLVDYEELEKFDLKLAEELLQNPDATIAMFEEALSELKIPMLKEEAKFYVRFINLPDSNIVPVKHLASEHINKFITVEGIVNRIGDILPKVSLGKFVCNRCGNEEWVEQPKAKRSLTGPIVCNSCDRRDFRFVPEESKFIDIQRMEIQESLEILKGGEQARRVEIWTEEDMTDRVTAGDKVIVNGILRLLAPLKQKGKGSVYFRFLDANYIESVEKEFEELDISEEDMKEIKELSKDPKIYDKLIDSIAPSIYGYREVKEAIVLQLFGGRHRKKLPDGTHVRPDIHLLMIGDPGVAKSRILQYVDEIAPKSVYVSGKSTSAGGLTAIAEKDEFAEGAWTLKAGALVIAGGGVACIDEFDKMEKADQSSMHEAMEQQTISVAKAGIIAKFRANTSILAASNPKFSRFDPYKPMGDQFDIPPTLLSRFDLIFPIRDILDTAQDKKIASHILKMHKGEAELEEIKPKIEVELFKKYIAYARINTFPVLSEDAAEKIKVFYTTLRESSAGGRVAATARQLEALVRLSEASAKTRLNDVVTVSDVERAIELTSFVLKATATDETGAIDIDRIVTEHPKSARDRIYTIENIVRELCMEREDKLAPIDDIVEKAAESRIDKGNVNKILNELKIKGILFEPRNDKWKWVG